MKWDNAKLCEMQQNTHGLVQLIRATTLDVPNQTPMPQLSKQMLNVRPIPPTTTNLYPQLDRGGCISPIRKGPVHIPNRKGGMQEAWIGALYQERPKKMPTMLTLPPTPRILSTVNRPGWVLDGPEKMAPSHRTPVMLLRFCHLQPEALDAPEGCHHGWPGHFTKFECQSKDNFHSQHAIKVRAGGQGG